MMIQSSRRYKRISELIIPQNETKVKRCEERKKKMSLFAKRALVLAAVGPASLYREDWSLFGLDKSDEACAALFGAMSGTPISAQEAADGSYLEKVKPISAAAWVSPDAPATVVAYGSHDKLQPFPASLRLKAALEKNGVDYKYFELPHSGHGLQNTTTNLPQ